MSITVETDTKATEMSTFIVKASFYDDEDQEVAPDTMAWSLTDEDGNIVNNREDIEISGPEQVEYIVLFGNDLAILDGEHGEEERNLVFEGTYTSNRGSDLPLNGQYTFYVRGIKKVT
jgi:hypothetical protein